MTTAALTLEIVEGPDAGRLVPLTGALELGSDPAAGLALADPHVEPHHARVSPQGDGALVEDLGRPGGTFVNDAELHDRTHIRAGDEIQVGITVLQLRRASDVEASPSAVRLKPPPLRIEGTAPGYVPPEVARQKPATPELDDLLDTRVKLQARTAPLAIFVLVVFAVMIFLATSKL